MRDLLARLFRRRDSAPRSAGDIALRLRVYADAMRYAAACQQKLRREGLGDAIEIPATARLTWRPGERP